MKTKGYAGKTLEVDLTGEEIKETTIDENILKQYIGGRGLSARILWDRLGSRWEEIDPLGPENLLIISTGPLTGYFPGGRVCISGKSPQSNGIVGSTVAGEFPIELRCAGYDAIIFSGKAEKPVYLFVTDGQAEIKDATHLWGKGRVETLKVLNREGIEELKKRDSKSREWKEPGAVYIGPAGETSSRVAAVLAKWTHGAGYGGYGGVMGSKNLKAVTVKGTGPLPKVANIKKVKKLINEVCEASFGWDIFRRWGTGYLGYTVGADMSSEPVRNWQEEWHNEVQFGVSKFEQSLWVKKYWGDFNCPTTCLKISMPKTGPYKGYFTDNPDYELQAYEGPNLGIFSPEANTYLVALIDDLGFCGIQAGNVLGFAAELYQRGILTKEDLGGLDLKWGNAEAFAKLLEMTSRREGIGDILAEGTYRAALKIGEMKGQDLLKYAVQEKGMSIGAHGIKSTLDYPMPISYACSTQSGDHTSTAYLPLTHGNSEHSIILHDSGVYCWFNTFKIEFSLIIDFLNAVTGWKVTTDEWYGTLAPRILQIQRAALLLGGPDTQWDPSVHDDNPPRFKEPLPSGPKAGATIDQSEFEASRKEYYQAVGWDEKGIPTSETLKRLGLNDVDKTLNEKVR